jgi:curved DNA-binding protein CbpA
MNPSSRRTILLKHSIITLVLATSYQVVHALIPSSQRTYNGVITASSSSFYRTSPINKYINKQVFTRTCIFALNYQNGGEVGDTSPSSQPPPGLPNTSDPYLILNIHYSASKDVIKKAYRTAALQYHPDVRTNSESTAEERQKAHDDFAKINDAYHSILTGRPFSNASGRRSNKSSVKSDSFSGGNKTSGQKPNSGNSGQGSTWHQNGIHTTTNMNSFTNNSYANVKSRVATQNFRDPYMKTYAQAYADAMNNVQQKAERRNPRTQPNKAKQDELHQRMKGGEFYDAKSFHERWNAQTSRSGEEEDESIPWPFPTPDQDTQERKKGGEYYDAEKFHQTFNPQPKEYRQKNVKKTPIRNRNEMQDQIMRGGEFYDAKSFHERWKPQSNPDSFNPVNDSAERVKGAEYYDANKFHQTFNKPNLRSQGNLGQDNTQRNLKLNDFFDSKSFHQRWDASGNGNSNIGIQPTARGNNVGQPNPNNLRQVRPRRYSPDTTNSGFGGLTRNIEAPQKRQPKPPLLNNQMSPDQRKMRGDFFDADAFHSRFNHQSLNQAKKSNNT